MKLKFLIVVEVLLLNIYNMKLITGETYIIRRQIKSFWYKWDWENKGWIWNNISDELQKLINDNNLSIEDIEDKELPELTKLDYDIAYVKKRLEKWEVKQEKKEIESQTTRMSEQERWFLRLWEPIKIWHHSEKRHRKLCEKMDRDWERRWLAYKEAEEAENKKKYWEEELKILEAKKNWTWLNAKEKKQKTIDLIKSKINVWDKCFYNRTECIIEKINKNTVKLNEFSFNVDIYFINI